jgi:transposase
VQYAPTITRMWSLKGHQPEISSYGGRKRQHLVGAVDPFGGDICIGLSYSLKAEQLIHFLALLLRYYASKEKIIVVLDNARAHHAKNVQDFVHAHEEKLELMFLPPYSPRLNPIERVWKKLRKRVTHNHFFETFEKFLRAIVRFFIKFKKQSKKIKSLCSYQKIFNSL